MQSIHYFCNHQPIHIYYENKLFVTAILQNTRNGIEPALCMWLPLRIVQRTKRPLRRTPVQDGHQQCFRRNLYHRPVCQPVANSLFARKRRRRVHRPPTYASLDTCHCRQLPDTDSRHTQPLQFGVSLVRIHQHVYDTRAFSVYLPMETLSFQKGQP